MKKLPILVLVSLALNLSITQSRAADLPPEHLPKNGIIGVIGDGKLKPWMIDLAKTGNVVVHYIAPDDAAVQRIGKAADQAGVGGKLLVESIPLKPLPYRENLLNGLVIEREGDFNRDAALKSVAPGGKLCALTDGKWKITTRKRPDGMDIWTHNYRNAGGNSGASTDQFVKFPLGLKWNDDLPFNLRTNQEASNAWTNTRAIAVVDGRIYYVTNAARENLKRTATEMANTKETQDMYLIARNAWNGVQLWRKKLGPIFYGGLFYTARAPMVAMQDKVYAVNKDQELLELDGETGETLRTFKTKFITSHLMLLDGVLVAATWKGGDYVGAKTGIDRRPLDITVTEGTIEAFDLASGEKIWEAPRMVTSLRGANGRVYLVDRNGADEYEIAKTLRNKRRGKEDAEKVDGRGIQKVVALDLKSGKVLWEIGAQDMGAKTVDHLAVGLAGFDGVAVSKNTYAITQSKESSGREAIWLDGASGKELIRRPGAGFPLLHDKNVHLGGVAYDPKTGQPAAGVKGINVGATVCTPQVYVNGIVTNNRSTNYRVDGQNKTFGAARGGCMYAAIPANGAFYTSQTYCKCAPGAVPGFISFGPIGTEPTEDQVKGGAKLTKGPAYGQQTGSGIDGWYTFMGNAERSNTNSSAKVPGGKVSIEWEKSIAKPMTDSNVEGSWKDSLAGLMTAPVASGGHVFAADLNRRKMVMLGAADGSVVWESYVGGRVTTPPTVYGDLCLFGASDGYVYALDVTDGSLAWKLRMGPEDRRMVSYAQLESPWSVFSSVLVAKDGIAYASAGRSTGAESGIVVRAFKPKTGEVIWSQVIAYRMGRNEHTNDAMYLDGDHLLLMKTIIDRKTGEFVANPLDAYALKVTEWKKARNKALQEKKPVPPQPEPISGLPMTNQGTEGLANPNWTKLGSRRRLNTTLDGVGGPILAWDDKSIVNLAQSVNRENGKPVWNSANRDEQVTAIAMGKNAVVFGGGLYPEDGSSQGFVRIVDRKTGKMTGTHRFPAPLSFQGLAIEGGKIYATFENGKLVCLGGE